MMKVRPSVLMKKDVYGLVDNPGSKDCGKLWSGGGGAGGGEGGGEGGVEVEWRWSGGGAEVERRWSGGKRR